MSSTFKLILGFGLCCMLSGCTQEATKSLDDAGRAVEDAATSAGTAVGEAAESAGAAAKSAAEDLGGEFAKLGEEARSAVVDVEGGSELLTKVTDIFKSAGESLKGVTDSESARAASDKLSEMATSVESLGPTFEKLPAEAKSAVAKMIEKGAAELKSLGDKVMALPGVESTIKPKLEEFMAKLDALAKKA
ncbi:MAG: hypothetical protein ACOY3P_11835 [Planctomycetota bacterium]